jgi:hypothetical protein
MNFESIKSAICGIGVLFFLVMALTTGNTIYSNMYISLTIFSLIFLIQSLSNESNDTEQNA